MQQTTRIPLPHSRTPKKNHPNMCQNHKTVAGPDDVTAKKQQHSCCHSITVVVHSTTGPAISTN